MAGTCVVLGVFEKRLRVFLMLAQTLLRRLPRRLQICKPNIWFIYVFFCTRNRLYSRFSACGNWEEKSNLLLAPESVMTVSESPNEQVEPNITSNISFRCQDSGQDQPEPTSTSWLSSNCPPKTKPYQCKFCQKSYKTERSLKCHLPVHLKPYICFIPGITTLF